MCNVAFFPMQISFLAAGVEGSFFNIALPRRPARLRLG
jgi:hypothetical protein